MHIRYGALSDVGRKRSHNEDCLMADADLGLFVVVDGMGGHAFGDVAAKVVAGKIRDFIARSTDDEATWALPFDDHLSRAANRMKMAVVLANDEVGRRIAAENQLRGMGATMSAVLMANGKAAVSNVGDCRTYLIRERAIRQISVDHSWVAEQVRNGVIAPEEARHHPWRNRVTRAVVGREGLEVELSELQVTPGDGLLICSDGLHGQVADDEILATVLEHPGDPQAAADALVATANERGAPDNVSVIVVEVTE